MITQEQVDRSMHYGQYRNLLQDLLAHGKTTGMHQSEDYLNYAKLNLQRMLRLDKTVALTPELEHVLKKVTGRYYWIVLTEGWCGDAAQSLPLMAKLEEACPSIALRLLLRDEHPGLMDQYLTHGSRSIPKLICVEQETLKELFTWGPRPQEAQAMIGRLKEQEVSKEDKSLAMQKWYNADKTISLQAELFTLISRFLLPS